ncbi:alpha-N-arabinofuranosidase [Tessaracoccus sp. MC1865]|uniref:arabinosylfuranosidase ArfA n=1 Tax=Tessaracoccus sp. MC1865 TaxID=2760310 RepID=UPI0015FFB197|nr:alpha-N-arabinofuranosidase [Tessaracoccus sp. MC1865]MBB1484423.1 alpha-N-arabinofuranosidase [Tessaracoccus sp. MC1865]QTO38472.1 alpha-N-arabinofuranosidase [Tessaracoccus sp. MC1865]
MHHAHVVINPAFRVGPVRRRTFGSFVEHLGRCVYTGIYEPGHPTADENGFRGDVLDLVRELGVSTVRYPGGNFVSGYRWEDGVGPVEDRPHRLDLAWHSSDPNTFGTDEFMAWARLAGIEPMMAVNLGTRGTQEALDLLEYCNVPGTSHFAEQRRANGADEPYRVRMWCLGNEMDGPWQIGHKTAEEYGRIATETARAMRMIDPSLELVACGSSQRSMPTFGEWERVVLTEAWDHVDMISAHAYYWEGEHGLQEFLVSAEDMDRFISQVGATIDAVGAARKSDKKIGISFDEWNIWYQDRTPSRPPTGDDWPVAPRLLEDNYSVADAVVFGNLLISLLRHTDRVWSANLAQLVNVIAPVMSEPDGPVWKQTTFHPFALTSRYARGEVLRVVIDSPTIESHAFGVVPAVDAVATWDESAGALFLVNRSECETIEVGVDVPAGVSLTEAVTLHHTDPRWQAGVDDDTTVAPRPNESATLTDGSLEISLPPISWTMVRFAG